mgnify:CR=1 FL=1
MGKYADLVAQYKKERQSKGVDAMPSPLKGMLSTANAATLGLGGQLYSVSSGAIEAAKGGEFSKGYQESRDLIKSIEKSYKDEYPNLSIGTQLAASLPATIYNPLPLKSSKIALFVSPAVIIFFACCDARSKGTGFLAANPFFRRGLIQSVCLKN